MNIKILFFLSLIIAYIFSSFVYAQTQHLNIKFIIPENTSKIEVIIKNKKLKVKRVLTVEPGTEITIRSLSK